MPLHLRLTLIPLLVLGRCFAFVNPSVHATFRGVTSTSQPNLGGAVLVRPPSPVLSPHLRRQRQSVASVQLQGLFGLGLGEIAVILVVVGFVLGPQNLGRLAASSTKRASAIKDELERVPEEFQKGLEEGESTARARSARRIKVVKDDDDKNDNDQDNAPDSSKRDFLIVAISSSAVGTGLLGETEPAEAVSDASASAPIDWQGIIAKSSKRALGGGKAGAAAAVVQVCTLMWLRTSMNYQYRYGGTLKSSLETLYSQGGVPRLYQGLPFALVQGPLTRFGDTAANVGVLALLESLDATRDLPLPLKTACGSLAAGAWRIILMPVDASKTAMQVEGADGLKRLQENISEEGPGVLYRGAVAQAAATAAGHFPWFLTYNALNEQLPSVSSESDLFLYLVRSAFLGLSASCVSDVVSNSLRVLKTTKQTALLSVDGKDLSYPEIVKDILEQDGLAGLLGRGLQTRLLTNAIQGALFSVCWKYFQQLNGAS